MRRLLIPLACVLLLASSASAQSVILSQYPPSRAAAANSLSMTLSTEDKAVLDAMATSLVNIDTDTTTIIGHLDGVEGLLTTIDVDTGNLAGILTSVQLLDNLVKAEDDASANLDPGLVIFARRTATPANTSGLDLDYEALQVNAGRLWASATIDAALPAGTNNIGDVDVLTLPSVTIGTFPDNEPFNVAQINGVAPLMGNGISGTGVQRVTLASDGTGKVMVWDGTDTLLIDGSGNLAVSCSNCTGSGVSAIDNSAFVGGTNTVASMGAVYDTTPPTITDGSVGAPRMDSSRYLYVVFPSAQAVSGTVTANLSATDNAVLDDIVDGTLQVQVSGEVDVFPASPAAGTYLYVRLTDGTNPLSPGTDYTHDAALTVATTTGPASMFLAGDFDGVALPSVVSLEGDAVLGRASLYGIQYMMLVSEDGSLQYGTATTPLVVDLGSNNDVTVTSGTVTANAGTGTFTVAGAKTNNNAAPGATNIGALVALANAAAPTWTEGNLVALSTDLAGALRVTGGGGGTEYVVNGIAPADPTGATFVMERDDALSALTEIEGDWTNPRGNANGALWVVVDGTVAATQSGTWNITNISGTISLPTGAATDATLANVLTSANFAAAFGTAGAADAQVLTVQGVASMTPILATVTGTVTANAGTDLNTSALLTTTAHDAAFGTAGTADAQVRTVQGIAGGTELPVSLASVPSHAVTNAGTFAVQVDGAALTALQLIDDAQTGDSVFYRTSAGTTEDEHEVKATAGRLFSVAFTNTNAAVRYWRCYNLTAANTTPGTSTVFLGLAIPGATTGAGFVHSFGPNGAAFSTALTCSFVTGAADSDVAEVAANEIKAVYSYK